MRTRHRSRTAGLALAIALVATACGGDDASPDDESGESDTEEAGTEEAGDEGGDEAAAGQFEGELIEIALGVSPGGGYDTYARALAPFLAEELGADVTVSNNSGAGGLLSLNNVYNAEPDGTTITLINGTGTLGSVLGGAEGVEFELGEFTWLGRLAAEPRVLNVHAGLEHETVEDLIGLEEEFTFASTGPGGGSHLTAALLMEVLDLQNPRFVTGFDGSAESNLAVVAGEVDGDANTASTSLPFVENGDQRVLVVIGDEPLEDMYPGVPSLYDVDLPEDRMEIAEALVAINGLGRALAAPPGMDEERTTELRQALENIVQSEEFQEEFEAQNLELDWRDAGAVEEIVASALGTSEEVRQVIADNS